jgi:outer membrane protein assembly factor BamE (lipoprotein component of BamABCDE complex)
MKPKLPLCVALIALTLAGCVNVDPDTGKTIPRGGQKFEYDVVKQRAEQLQVGMSKLQVIILLGSPAETSASGDIWAYLPERPAVLLPASGLRLVFQNNLLQSHEFTTIVFGQPL